MRFRYRALDAQGQRRVGTLESESARHVRQWLREQQLQPLSITETKTLVRQRPAFTPRERAAFMQQLATLIRARLPLDQTLQALAQQHHKPAQRAMLLDMHRRVCEGCSLAEAMTEHRQTFPALYATMIAAGESTGQMAHVLGQLAEYSEKTQEMRSRILQALIYPALLLVVACGVVVILLTAVVPDVVAQFTHMQHALPWTTRVLMLVSDTLRASTPLLAAILMVTAVALLLAQRHAAWRHRWHRWQLRIPIWGRLLLATSMARYVRTLSIMTQSAVPLLEGMRLSASVTQNHYMQMQLYHAAERVREGTSLTQALEHTGLLPTMMHHMLASGESSGELDIMLRRAADIQEQTMYSQMRVAIGLFEPLMTVSMACVVLFIILAILQPILQLNSLL